MRIPEGRPLFGFAPAQPRKHLLWANAAFQGLPGSWRWKGREASRPCGPGRAASSFCAPEMLVILRGRRELFLNSASLSTPNSLTLHVMRVPASPPLRHLSVCPSLHPFLSPAPLPLEPHFHLFKQQQQCMLQVFQIAPLKILCCGC